MDREFEDAFDSNNKFHVKWLKDLVNFKEGVLIHNPFGIYVENNEMYLDIVTKLSKKFINESVCYYYKNLFSYQYAYQSDGEYQDCTLLREIRGYKKGTKFNYILVYPTSIHFFMYFDDPTPTMILEN